MGIDAAPRNPQPLVLNLVLLRQEPLSSNAAQQNHQCVHMWTMASEGRPSESENPFVMVMGILPGSSLFCLPIAGRLELDASLRGFVTPPPSSHLPLPLPPPPILLSCHARCDPSAFSLSQSGLSCCPSPHVGSGIGAGRKGAPRGAGVQIGLRYPSSERGKWPLCLSPISATAEGSTRCWSHKGGAVEDVCTT